MTVEVVDSGAMPALAVLEDFLNTRDERSFTVHGTRHPGGDELATPAALADWLARRGLINAGTRTSGTDLRDAHALRGALRGALAARADPGWDGLASANQVLAGLSLRIELDTGGTPHLAPVAGGAVPGALARLAASAAAAAADGSWQRLKMCAAPDCRWVFHDTSRNGLGRWCSMRVCGNRDKTRAYRQRHGPSPPTSRRALSPPFQVDGVPAGLRPALARAWPGSQPSRPACGAASSCRAAIRSSRQLAECLPAPEQPAELAVHAAYRGCRQRQKKAVQEANRDSIPARHRPAEYESLSL